MTKIDQGAAVPVLDAAARERLAAALDRHRVVGAMIFGSQVAGRPGPLSDIDVAVWLEPGLPASERLALRLDLAGAAAEALGTGEIDLVVLNDAPPLLGHRAIRDGVLILDRDPRARIRLQTEALLTYLDTAPLRRALSEARKARMAEGRFGRR